MRIVNYYEEIESHVRRLRGTPLWMASPKEWALMSKWEGSGIELDVVLRGIDLSFQSYRRSHQGGDNLIGLAYCEPLILGLSFRLQSGTVACACGERYDPQRDWWNSGREVKTCKKCAPPQEAHVVTSGVCIDCHKDQPILVDGVCNTCQHQREKCSQAKEGV